jgi:hypothetical protein
VSGPLGPENEVLVFTIVKYPPLSQHAEKYRCSPPTSRVKIASTTNDFDTRN